MCKTPAMPDPWNLRLRQVTRQREPELLTGRP